MSEILASVILTLFLGLLFGFKSKLPILKGMVVYFRDIDNFKN